MLYTLKQIQETIEKCDKYTPRCVECWHFTGYLTCGNTEMDCPRLVRPLDLIGSMAFLKPATDEDEIKYLKKELRIAQSIGVRQNIELQKAIKELEKLRKNK